MMAMMSFIMTGVEDGSVHLGKSTTFAPSSSPSVQGVPLQSFGTNLIYREVDEMHSLSKVQYKRGGFAMW
jgi:hypothetical protein